MSTATNITPTITNTMPPTTIDDEDDDVANSEDPGSEALAACTSPTTPCPTPCTTPGLTLCPTLGMNGPRFNCSQFAGPLVRVLLHG